MVEFERSLESVVEAVRVAHPAPFLDKRAQIAATVSDSGDISGVEVARVLREAGVFHSKIGVVQVTGVVDVDQFFKAFEGPNNCFVVFPDT